MGKIFINTTCNKVNVEAKDEEDDYLKYGGAGSNEIVETLFATELDNIGFK